MISSFARQLQKSILSCGIATLLLGHSSAIAAEGVAAPIVKGEAVIKAPGASSTALTENQTVPAGSEIKTGRNGEVAFDFNTGSRAVIMANSKVIIAGAVGPQSRKVSSGFQLGSALKSVLTHNDASAQLNQAILPLANLALNDGSMISVVEQSRQVITLPLGFAYGTNGSFITSVENADTERVTVRDGFVTVGLPDNSTVSVKAGQFIRVTRSKSRAGFTVTGPSKSSSDPLAGGDLVAFNTLQATDKELLAPIAEFIAGANTGQPGNVGTGLSAPFDILVRPPNPSNEREREVSKEN